MKDAAATYGIPESQLQGLDTQLSDRPDLTDDLSPALRLAQDPRPRYQGTAVQK